VEIIKIINHSNVNIDDDVDDDDINVKLLYDAEHAK
jgi:hypothetical protein